MADSTKSEHITVLAIQPAIGKITQARRKTAHLKQLTAKIEERILAHRGSHVDLVALPELVSIDYSDEAFKNLNELAEPLHGETFQTFRKIAQRYSLYISTGFARKEGALNYISNIVINPSGDIETCYDKVHIAHFGFSKEKHYFQRGKSLSFFDLKAFRIGVVICYDFRFPEYLRTLVQKRNVNVLLHPVAFVKDATYPSWHHFVITRALENQVYFLSLNRAGDSWGSSILCPPWIDDSTGPQIFSSAEEASVFQLRYEEILNARRTYRFADDRLKDYGSLDEPSLNEGVKG